MKRLHTYSQNFLRNPRFVRELIGHTSIKKSDIVYDIGAGSGIISSALAGRCKQVIAIEAESKTASTLRKNVDKYDNISVEEGDFLEMPLPSGPYKILANIPFHISSAIVHKITNDKNPPVAAYLIVQKQFANKLLPDHKGFSSQLGMLLGPRFAIRIRKHLKRTDFWPHPNVDTVLLEIKAREVPLIPASQIPSYERFIKINFTIPSAFAKLPLHVVSKKTSVKPSSLTLAQWLILFRAIGSE